MDGRGRQQLHLGQHRRHAIGQHGCNGVTCVGTKLFAGCFEIEVPQWLAHGAKDAGPLWERADVWLSSLVNSCFVAIADVHGTTMNGRDKRQCGPAEVTLEVAGNIRQGGVESYLQAVEGI